MAAERLTLGTAKRSAMHYRHNQVQLTGRVATDPELYFISDGTAKSRLYLLQDRRADEAPSRFVVVGWAGLARRLHEVVRAGDRLFVQGELRTRSYVADGQNHLRTEIHLESYVLLKSPRATQRLAQSRNRTTEQ